MLAKLGKLETRYRKHSKDEEKEKTRAETEYERCVLCARWEKAIRKRKERKREKRRRKKNISKVLSLNREL